MPGHGHKGGAQSNTRFFQRLFSVKAWKKGLSSANGHLTLIILHSEAGSTVNFCRRAIRVGIKASDRPALE
jgi:hypothetical protein